MRTIGFNLLQRGHGGLFISRKSGIELVLNWFSDRAVGKMRASRKRKQVRFEMTLEPKKRQSPL